MQRTPSQIDPFDDPACGSGGFIRLLAVSNANSNNEEELACFHAQSQQRNAALTSHLKERAELARNAVGGSSPNADSQVFDVVLTSLPLDLVTTDTLWLSIPVSPGMIGLDHQLKVVPASGGRKNRVLWQREDGERIEGARATWQGEGIHVQISPLQPKWIGQGSTACVVKLSLPGIVGAGFVSGPPQMAPLRAKQKDNSWPTDSRSAVGIFARVQKVLTEIGITTDVRHARISRAHLSRNMVLNEPVRNYRENWKAMNQVRTEWTEWEKTGALCSNQSQKFGFYDKIDQMKKAGLKTAHLPKNLGRFEWKINRVRNVRKNLNIETVQDLVDQWQTLPELFRSHAKKTWFRHDVAELRKPRPIDSYKLGLTRRQIRNLARWCQKKQIELPFTTSELEGILHGEGLDAYAKAIHSVPGLGEGAPRANQKHAKDAVRRMREAFWREKVLTDPDFVRRYEEMRGKIEGGC